MRPVNALRVLEIEHGKAEQKAREAAPARYPPRPPEWMDFGGNVSNVLHLPNGIVIYDIRVPRADWLGRLLRLEKTETRIAAE